MPHFRHEGLSRYLDHKENRDKNTGSPVCVHRSIDFRSIGDYIERMGIPATFWRSQGIPTGSRGRLSARATTNMGDTMAKPKRGRSTGAIDDFVGGRIRERRIMLGLTQQQLAEMIGVTYQQAHKYERGINRVSAGRLYEIARVLNAPITYFYEGLGEETPRPVAPHQRMLLEIARNFAEIQNEKHQEAVSQLARVLAGR
jgi:transcriptional regulator with XRE-family HTH domain